MQEIKLAQIAQALGVPFSGEGAVTEVVTDSRLCGPGKLFVALVGDRADGNDFVPSALERGAEAAVATRLAPGADPARVMLVPDGRLAMIAIGALARARFDIPFVGVTGSVGKTTTKEFIHAVLSAKYNTLKNLGNQNDEVGVPNTLFRLEAAHEAAIIEMGMSGRGQIHDLTMAVRPSVGVITSVGTSHLEHLGTRENILRAKLEIRDGMPDGAPLFLCGDNDLLCTVQDERLRVFFYGITNPGCDIRGEDLEQRGEETFFTIHSPWGEYSARIPAVGRHNVVDALAAFGVGCVMGVRPEQAAQSLADYIPTGMRQKVTHRNGVTVVEDCYNCSPDSLRAAALTLASYPAKGRRILVLSDMLELGPDSPAMHRACGNFIAKQGIDLLMAFGPLSRSTADGAADAGLERSVWYETKEELAAALHGVLREGDVAWFKASRGQKLEDVVRLIYGEEEEK